MKIPYYPGCTLKTTARNFEDSARAVAKVFGMELEEMPRWNCCGTVYSLATDDLMHQLAPLRNLMRVRESGYNRVVTLCSMCYHTLKRANQFIQEDEEKRQKVNNFMDDEDDYNGEVEVLHLLEILRDDVGFDEIAQNVTKPLNRLRVAPYYGCLLLRPSGVGLDEFERPTILSDVLRPLGVDVVNDPYKTECCGSYETVNNVNLVIERTRDIVSSAVKRGAEALVLSCPLCDFNLDHRQREVVEKYSDFKGIPVFYFTQLLAMALGLDEGVCGFDLHFVDPRPLLKSKGLL